MHPRQPLLLLQLQRCVASLLGAAFGYGLAAHLPLVPSTLLSALVRAAGASCSDRLPAGAPWWSLIGLAGGTLVGTGSVLATHLQQGQPPAQLGHRALVVALLAVAGLIAGQRLSVRRPARADRRPRDLLRSASAFTTGVFAAIVTLTYIHAGLDAARTFSSRLSTALTILVLSVAAPAWLGHLLVSTPGKGDDR